MDTIKTKDEIHDPFFTVIVPVYKAEAYLEDSISSVLGQTFGDFELWLIDDGSPDGSGRICDQIARQDPRVHVHHQTNQGPSSARNYGLEHARGKYVCFMDADDRVKPDWLNAYHQHADADVLIQGCEIVAEDGTVGQYTTIDKLYMTGGGKSEVIKAISGPLYADVWSKAIRRRLIISHVVRFDESLRLNEDDIFVICCLSVCQSVRTIGYIGYIHLKENSFLTRVDYDFEARFNIKRHVVKAIDTCFPDGKDNKARHSLYEKELSIVICGVLNQGIHIPRRVRLLVYQWLREYRTRLDFSQFGPSLQVYRFLWLPDPIFDIVLLTSIRVKPALKRIYYTLKPKK